MNEARPQWSLSAGVSLFLFLQIQSGSGRECGSETRILAGDEDGKRDVFESQTFVKLVEHSMMTGKNTSSENYVCCNCNKI